VDWYQFSVPSSGLYIVDTDAGTLTDSVLSLYGPDSQTTLIATVDNVSGDQMAQLTRSLAPGTYYVKVTGSGSSTGTYTIRVSSALYSDDFSDSSLWFTGQKTHSNCWYESGRYLMSVDAEWNSSSWRTSWVASDGVVSVEAQGIGVQTSLAYAYGILARYASDASGASFYLFQVDTAGNASIWMHSPSGWTLLATAPLPSGVNAGGAVVTLTASLRGSSLALRVNGTQVVSTTNNNLASGMVGLYVESSAGTPTVAFDNMYVLP
jgi:hypothetical protein